MTGRGSLAGGPPSPGAELFCHEGEYWTIEFAGVLVRLRDGKGFHYLAHLLGHPGQEFSVVELMAQVASDRGHGSGRIEEYGSGSRHSTPLLAGEGKHGTQDPGIGTAELERARSAVTKRIKDAMKRIQARHPVLGRHLTIRIKTGYSCVYLPDPDRPTRWVVSGALGGPFAAAPHGVRGPGTEHAL